MLHLCFCGGSLAADEQELSSETIFFEVSLQDLLFVMGIVAGVAAKNGLEQEKTNKFEVIQLAEKRYYDES